jgi:manganese/zinc/iron transport system substrate-binding protein
VSKSLAALPLFLVAAATACGQPVGTAGRPDVTGRELRLVATTGMVGDLVAAVAGGRAEVTSLMGPGIDPHVYKASEGDVLTLAEADAIFYNGLHLEAKMADVLERIEGRLLTVAVAEGVPEQKLLRPPEFEGAYDPHVWFDVALWQEALDEVERALVRLDPAHAAAYRANARRYRARLADVDAEVRRLVATVPESRRVLVTAHDAFGYFGAAYGFQVRGLQGISTAAEAGAADVQALADFVVERRTPAIFVESSVPRQTVRAVQEAVRSRGFEVEIGAELFSDAMGDPGTPEGTYPGMVLHNVRVIVDALGGEGDVR